MRRSNDKDVGRSADGVTVDLERVADVGMAVGVAMTDPESLVVMHAESRLAAYVLREQMVLVERLNAAADAQGFRHIRGDESPDQFAAELANKT